MIVEQIRYFVSAEASVEGVLEGRRQLDAVRRQIGLPEGRILVADPPVDDAPTVVWQCGYQSETELAVAEARIAGSDQYILARNQLVELVERTEIELYTSDEHTADE